jgi:hypothetical protein
VGVARHRGILGISRATHKARLSGERVTSVSAGAHFALIMEFAIFA